MFTTKDVEQSKQLLGLLNKAQFTKDGGLSSLEVLTAADALTWYVSRMIPELEAALKEAEQARANESKPDESATVE